MEKNINMKNNKYIKLLLIPFTIFCISSMIYIYQNGFFGGDKFCDKFLVILSLPYCLFDISIFKYDIIKFIISPFIINSILLLIFCVIINSKINNK